MNFNSDSGKFQTSKLETSNPSKGNTSLDTFQQNLNGEYEEYEEETKESKGTLETIAGILDGFNPKKKIEKLSPKKQIEDAIATIKEKFAAMGINTDNFSEQLIYDHKIFFLSLAVAYSDVDLTDDNMEEIALDIVRRISSSNITYEELKANFSNIDEVICSYLQPHVDEAGLGIRLNNETVKILYENLDVISEFTELFLGEEELEPQKIFLDVIDLVQEKQIPYKNLNLIFEDLPGTLQTFVAPYEQTLGIELNFNDKNVRNLYEAFLEDENMSRGRKITNALLDIYPELPNYISDVLRKNNVFISARAIEKRLPNLFYDFESTMDCLSKIQDISSDDVMGAVGSFSDICDLLDIGFLARTSIVGSTTLSFGADYITDSVVTDIPADQWYTGLLMGYQAVVAAGGAIAKEKIRAFSEGVIDSQDDFEQFKEDAGELFDAAREKGEEIVDGIREKGEEFVDGIREKGEELLENAGEAFEEAKDNLIEWGSQKAEEIAEGAEELKDMALEWGAEQWDGLGELASGAVDCLTFWD